MITTPIKKNNTIRYKGSRYTVPFGTYTHCKEASIREVDGHLGIYGDTGQLLALHFALPFTLDIPAFTISVSTCGGWMSFCKILMEKIF